jgi:hypothetical protein
VHRLILAPSAPFFPTASELHRAAECVAPWALGLEEQDDAGEWAEHGRRLHFLAELVAHGQSEIEVLSRVFRDPEPDYEHIENVYRLIVPMVEADIEASKLGVWHVEAGIKWRSDGYADEVELCERAPGERMRGWFSGTADLVYVRQDGVLLVADWKFGPRERITGEPAAHSCQGFFLAMAFASLLEVSASSDNEVIARFERRMVSEAGIEVDGYDITQGELYGFAEQLRGLGARIIKADGAMPRISAACGKCKAKAACPGWEAQYLAVIESSRHAHESLLAVPATDEEAARMHHAIEAAESLVEQWKEHVKAYVLTHPDGVPIGLGLKLKAIPSKDREVLDTPEAIDVIERIAGPKAIEVQRKTGVGLIKAAARDGVDKSIKSAADRDKSKKAAEERVIAELIQAGAVLDKGKKLSVREVRTGEE